MVRNVPLKDIVPNPWRNIDRFPPPEEQVAHVSDSIEEHTFWQNLVGRERNAKIELAFGHIRAEGARKAKLKSIPIDIRELDDDEMLRCMTDENALQSGSNPGAIMNETTAIIQRLIQGLYEGIQGQSVPVSVGKAFESKRALEIAMGRLQKRAGDSDADVPISYHPILRYLGRGDEKKSRRGERQIREAISALKQSGTYDEIIDEAIAKYAPAVADAPAASGTAVAKKKESKSKRRTFDERTANLFPNDHQFHAFREAVTTQAAQKAIPVAEQLALAKQIMDPKQREGFSKKQVGAPYIKTMVHARVEEFMKEQRKLDKEERDRYLAEQIEARVEDELYTARASLRSLISAIAKLLHLVDKYPALVAHPKITGFSARLDDVVGAIDQLSKKLEPDRAFRRKRQV